MHCGTLEGTNNVFAVCNSRSAVAATLVPTMAGSVTWDAL